MFNVCPGCGAYAVEKAIDPRGPFAVCPTCGHRHRFLQQPLFILTGASGAGKSTICLELPARLPECVSLETDILWRPEFNRPENDYQDFRDTWLRLAKNIGQGGRPVVLRGSAIPEQFEHRPERRYFASLHYLALVCDDAALADRLRARPGWRQSSGLDFIERMIAFNRWLKTNANQTTPPMTCLDTTCESIADTVGQVVEWVRARLG